jgi:hypothetical protein
MAWMKKISVILLSIICLPVSSFGMWALIPLDVLVQDSDFIIVGTLRDVSHWSTKGVDYGRGVVTVDEVIWGEVTAGELFTLKWQNESGLICPRVEHKEREGQKGIWLLTSGPGTGVRADYPWRFVELEKRDLVERALVEKKVCTRSLSWVLSPEDPVYVSIVLRNATANALSVPMIEYLNGYLRLSPEVELKVSKGWEPTEIVEPIRGRISIAEGMAPIVLHAGQEHRINLNMRDLFDITSSESYSFHVRIKGLGSGNEQSFYVDPTQNRNRRLVDDESSERPIAGAGLSSDYVPAALVLFAVLVFRRFRGRATAGQQS